MIEPEMTLADHAEAWARENGEAVSAQGTPEWMAMYERWMEYAFPENWSKD